MNGPVVIHVAALAGLAALLQAPPDLVERRAELAAAHADMIAQSERGDFVGAVSSVIAPAGFYGAALSTDGRGPDAARSFLLRDTLNARSRGIMVVVRLDVSADGNDGYSYGYLDLIRSNGDTLRGAYKSYWRRETNGKWRVLCFGRSPRSAGEMTMLPDSLKAATRSSTPGPAQDRIAARKSLEAAEVAFSDSSARDMRAAFMHFAAPDAGKIEGAAYVFGREAIGRQYQNPPPDFQGISWYAAEGVVAGSNDLGFNYGPVTRRGSTAAPGGRFFTIWKRQPNGEWKYLVD